MLRPEALRQIRSVIFPTRFVHGHGDILAPTTLPHLSVIVPKPARRPVKAARTTESMMASD
jgi:hypothetical protein